MVENDPYELFEIAEDGDRETVREVAEYLSDGYTQPNGQGPIWITGSALDSEEPNDYDLVVQRQAEDEREQRISRSRVGRRQRNRSRPGAIPMDRDFEIIAQMMRDLSNDEDLEDYDENTNQRKRNYLLQESTNVRMYGNIGQNHNPETRFGLNIDDVDLDIVFSPAKPTDHNAFVLEP